MKSSIRLIVVSVVIWFGLSAGSANAVDSDLGTLTGLETITSLKDPGIFVDQVEFDLLASGVGGSGQTFPFSFGATQILGINPFEIQLFAGPNGDNSSPIATFSQVTQGTFFDFNQPLVPGTFHLAITGTATGATGGAYALAISPVPEPETYAMLLIGLGLVAFTARRRRKYDFSY